VRTAARHAAIVALVTLPLAAAPGLAAAATPPTLVAPSTASIAAGRPLFTWTAGPAGEQVGAIALGRGTALGADAMILDTDPGERLVPAAGATSARPTSALHAGRWYWTAAWSTAAGDPAPASGATGAASFVVPARIAALRGAFTQYTASPVFTARGSFSGNVAQVAVTCSVYDGRELVTRRRDTVASRLGRRTAFTCRGMRVPERLDDRRLRLVVAARGSGRRVVAGTRFTAS
jgi:hypothetical protein